MKPEKKTETPKIVESTAVDLSKGGAGDNTIRTDAARKAEVPTTQPAKLDLYNISSLAGPPAKWQRKNGRG